MAKKDRKQTTDVVIYNSWVMRNIADIPQLIN